MTIEGSHSRYLRKGFSNEGGSGTSPVIPGTGPRNLCTGLTARSYAIGSDPTQAKPLIDSIVINPTWAQLQPTSGSTLDTNFMANTIMAQLNWAHNTMGTLGRPIRVRFRIDTGVNSPAWAIASAGGMNWATNDGLPTPNTWTPTPSSTALKPWYYMPGQVPIWWSANHKANYANLMSLLAAYPGFADHPALGEICMSLGCTQYDEPTLHQFANLENRTLAIANGYSETQDTAAFVAGWTAHMNYFAGHGVACHTPYNPKEYIKVNPDNSTQYKTSSDMTIALMEQHYTICGPLTVWANNSLINPLAGRNDPYTAVYQRMIAGRLQTPPVAITFQSKNLNKIASEFATDGSTVPGTIQMDLDWKGTTLEIPAGCWTVGADSGRDYISPTAAAAYNAQFWSQSQDLMTISGGSGGSSGGVTAPPNVMIVVMENESNDITNGTNWPKASVLAGQYAYLTQYYGIAHPSQPNYLHLVAGDNFGVADDSITTGLTATTIFDQLTTAGVAWKTYAEALPGTNIAVNQTINGGNNYLCRHNIISAFSKYEPTSALVVDAGSTANIATATWPTLVGDLNSTSYPKFVYFCPTPANQGHSGYPTSGPWQGATTDADNFISKFTTAVKATQWYADGGTILFVWDEGSTGDNTSGFNVSPLNGSNGGGHTNFLVISETAKNVGAVTGLMNAWGVLGDIQDKYGIATALGRSQGAWGSCAQLYSPFVATGGGGTSGGNPWDHPDSTVVTTETALYLIAGALFADPKGQEDSSGNITINSSSNFHWWQGKPSDGSISPVVQQFAAACTILGATVTFSVTGSGANQNDRVDVTGLQASYTSNHDTGPASLLVAPTGKQARAYAAAFIQDEGSKAGKVGDDPSQAHLQVIGNLLATTNCYNVATNITTGSGGFHGLYVTSSNDYPKIDAYPFVTWGRVPGGHP